MGNEKTSTLKSIDFSRNDTSMITRITSFEHVIDFLVNQHLHFSPFTCFNDQIEGMTFAKAKEVLIGEENDNNALSTAERRKLLYCSCWYGGDESLHMWEIYSKFNPCSIAIQFDRIPFIKNIFNSGNFFFKSATCSNFKLNLLAMGDVEYLDFLEGKDLDKKYALGRFKDVAFKHENEFRVIVRQNNKDSIETNLSDLKCQFTNNTFNSLNLKLILSPYISDNIEYMIKAALKELDNNLQVTNSKYSKLFNVNDGH